MSSHGSWSRQLTCSVVSLLAPSLQRLSALTFVPSFPFILQNSQMLQKMLAREFQKKAGIEEAPVPLCLLFALVFVPLLIHSLFEDR